MSKWKTKSGRQLWQDDYEGMRYKDTGPQWWTAVAKHKLQQDKEQNEADPENSYHRTMAILGKKLKK